MKKTFVIGLFCLLVGSVEAADKYCQITRVIDGDTVEGKCDDVPFIRIRLTSIDSYESKRNNRAYKQAYTQQLSVEEIVNRGHKATEITKQYLEGKHVKVVIPEKTPVDKYGRTLGELFIDDVDINLKLLRENPTVFLKY